jgi:hypothetical protein
MDEYASGDALANEPPIADAGCLAGEAPNTRDPITVLDGAFEKEFTMLLQTLVLLGAWMLADREPTPEDIAMRKSLVAEVAATGSLTFGHKSDLVLFAKSVDGDVLKDVTVVRAKSANGNFRVDAKRAKLAIDTQRGRVYLGLWDYSVFAPDGRLVREGGAQEDDHYGMVVYLMDLSPAAKRQR